MHILNATGWLRLVYISLSRLNSAWLECAAVVRSCTYVHTRSNRDVPGSNLGGGTFYQF